MWPNIVSHICITIRVVSQVIRIRIPRIFVSILTGSLCIVTSLDEYTYMVRRFGAQLFTSCLCLITSQEKELEASKKEKVKEAKLEAEVKMLKKENEALRRHIAVLQAEVYGARLAAKYLDKELAGR